MPPEPNWYLQIHKYINQYVDLFFPHRLPLTNPWFTGGQFAPLQWHERDGWGCMFVNMLTECWTSATGPVYWPHFQWCFAICTKPGWKPPDLNISDMPAPVERCLPQFPVSSRCLFAHSCYSVQPIRHTQATCRSALDVCVCVDSNRTGSID